MLSLSSAGNIAVAVLQPKSKRCVTISTLNSCNPLNATGALDSNNTPLALSSVSCTQSAVAASSGMSRHMPPDRDNTLRWLRWLQQQMWWLKARPAAGNERLLAVCSWERDGECTAAVVVGVMDATGLGE